MGIFRLWCVCLGAGRTDRAVPIYHGIGGTCSTRSSISRMALTKPNGRRAQPDSPSEPDTLRPWASHAPSSERQLQRVTEEGWISPTTAKPNHPSHGTVNATLTWVHIDAAPHHNCTVLPHFRHAGSLPSRSATPGAVFLPVFCARSNALFQSTSMAQWCRQWGRGGQYYSGGGRKGAFSCGTVPWA